jgi:hypothetical protein
MNPWKVTAIGMAVMMVTALVTGLVVANWTGADRAFRTQKPQQQATPARVASAPAAPTRTAIDACNKYAASEAGSTDKALEVAKDGAIGAVVGAAVVGAGGGTLYGLNESKKHDERYRTAYASCMRARGFTS